MTADEKLEGIKTFCLFRNAEIEADDRFQAKPAKVKIKPHLALALYQISMEAEHKTLRRILDRCK